MRDGCHGDMQEIQQNKAEQGGFRSWQWQSMTTPEVYIHQQFPGFGELIDYSCSSIFGTRMIVRILLVWVTVRFQYIRCKTLYLIFWLKNKH